VENESRAPDFIPERLAESTLASAWDAEQKDAPWTRQRAGLLAGQGALAERFEPIKTAQVGECLAATVDRHQAALLECLGLQLPHYAWCNPAMANQRERERVLGLDTGQAHRGI